METIKNAASTAAKAFRMGENVALPKGSWILVTGASGYIGSHIVKEALDAGYKVRGTVRSEEKAANTRNMFGNNPDYFPVMVPDFSEPDAFHEAVKGVSAVIHVASDTSFSPDPHKVIQPSVKGVQQILRSAAKQPKIKRFVLTSSSTAAGVPSYDKENVLTAETWDQEAVDLAWAPPPYTDERSFAVYRASKVEGERALWNFVEEEKPSFVCSTILPNMNIGRILPGGSGGATGNLIPAILKGELPNFPNQYMIDVIDDARIHVIAAALDNTVKNERIYAYNQAFTWTEIINIVKKHRPDATSVAQAPANERPDLTKVPNQRGAELLKKWYGQDGYKSMEQSVLENLEGQ
jgi:nucleoside-diphosphate-sugar epimerase